METVKKLQAAVSRRLWFVQKALPEPEPTYGKSRPATGFFANLTDDQKKRALAYRGDENHGDPRFARG